MTRGIVALLGQVVLASLPVAAELQEVRVGGKVEIYGAYYSDFFAGGDGYLAYPPAAVFARPLGPNGALTGISVGDDDTGLGFLEQRTRLYFDADFNDDVRTYIEFDAIDTWGEDFRSNYVTGLDRRAATGDDVELYQAYIEADNFFDLPLTFRVGRQELEFGSGWLVGADPGPDPFVGLSFDALRLTYAQGGLAIDGWWSKVAENFDDFGDGDVDFMGLHARFVEEGDHELGERMREGGLASYMFMPSQLVHHAIKDFGPFGRRIRPVDTLAVFDLYWMYVRDDRRFRNTMAGPVPEFFESFLGLDDYGTTHLHTAGARIAGEWSGFDYEIEAAYQWGEADSLGARFVPFGRVYGDTDASWSNWAGHAQIGYTFDVAHAPRVYLGGSYYGGEDRRGISFWEWLNPRQQGGASISFNRLFSSWREDAFIDGSAMTNFWKVHAGVTANFPTDAVEVGFDLAYLEVVEPFHRPVLPFLPFWTREAASELGWQTTLYAVYAYSDDLTFEVGWSHYFTGAALDDGAYIDSNGLDLIGGGGSDDVDYAYFLTTVEF